MKLNLFALAFIVVLFTGCVKNIDSNGLTLKLDESELNTQSDKFPMKQDFVFANVNLEQPKIFIKNGQDRLNAKMDLSLAAIFIPHSKGVFELSGVPYFNKEKSAIFLKDVNIDELTFNELNLNKNLTNMLMVNMKPVIDHIFTNIPIYKIDKHSFKGSFVKDVKIEDSELLVTFGL